MLRRNITLIGVAWGMAYPPRSSGSRARDPRADPRQLPRRNASSADSQDLEVHRDPTSGSGARRWRRRREGRDPDGQPTPVVTRPLRIACSETALDRPLLDAWDVARRCGIEGTEVYGVSDELQRRLATLRSAKRQGLVVQASVPAPISRADRRRRRRSGDPGRPALDLRNRRARGRRDRVASGGPAVDWTDTRILQPYLVEALAGLADHAESVGTTVCPSPSTATRTVSSTVSSRQSNSARRSAPPRSASSPTCST